MHADRAAETKAQQLEAVQSTATASPKLDGAATLEYNAHADEQLKQRPNAAGNRANRGKHPSVVRTAHPTQALQQMIPSMLHRQHLNRHAPDPTHDLPC